MSKAQATVLFASVVLAGCAKTEKAPQAAAADTTTHARVMEPVIAQFDGVGRARIGSTTAQLSAAGTVPAADGSDACRIVAVDWLPPGTRLMLVKDTLVRIDADSTSGLRTIEGAGIGDTEAHIRQLYPNAETQPHKYVANGHYLSVPSPNDSTRRIVFETDGNTVKHYRIGRRPEVDFVEGCG